jgi:hypothetical protein
MSFQAVAKLSNRHSLYIGEISKEEADSADQDSEFIDGFGVYLVKVSNEQPISQGVVLAKFASVAAARELAQFFRLSGRLEVA